MSDIRDEMEKKADEANDSSAEPHLGDAMDGADFEGPDRTAGDDEADVKEDGGA